MNKQLAEYASSNGRPDERTEAEIEAAMFTDELVTPDRSCTCGERRMDWLVWDDDAINVTCASCGAVFRPGGA